MYGADEYSGAPQLVNALLEEPFAPDVAKVRVRERWKGVEGSSNLVLRSVKFTSLNSRSTVN